MQANTLHFDDSLNITCYTCKHKHNGGYKFPCEHEYCPKCFHQLLFNKCIHNITDSPTITITCSCDNSNASKISLEEIYNVLSKSINDNTIIPLDPEQCLEHIAQPSSLFCKTCNKNICIECSTSEHKDHKYSDKKIFSEQFHSYLRNLPLNSKTFNAFTLRYNDITSNFQNKVETLYKETINRFDLIISNLNELKSNFTKVIKERAGRGVLILKIIKMFYANFYINYEQNEKINDIFTLRYLRNISHEFTKFSFEMDSYILEELNQIKTKCESIKTSKDYFTMNASYTEIAKVFVKEQKLKWHKKEITSIIKLNDGRLVTGGGDFSIRFWELKGDVFENTTSIEEFTGFVMALYQLNDKRIISSSRQNNNTRIWNQSNGKYSCDITLSEHTDDVTCMIQLADDRLVTGSRDSHICIWVPSKKLFQCKEHLIEHQSGVYSLLELSGNQIASGSDDKTIRIWEGKDTGFVCVQILGGHLKRVKALTKLSGDSARFVSGGDDCTMKIWEQDQKGLYMNVFSIEAHHSSVLCLQMLSDSRLISTSKDRSMRIWQVNGNKLSLKEKLKEHTSSVYGVVELDDGRLVSCSGDGHVVIWKNGNMHED